MTTANPVAGASITSPEEWAIAQLKSLGDPVTASNIEFLEGWQKQEGGNWNNTATYNPLNTTQPEPGATAMNSVGVKAYTSWTEGIQATDAALNNGLYSDILAALKSGNAASAGSSGSLASGLSTWSGGGYTTVSPTTGVNSSNISSASADAPTISGSSSSGSGSGSGNSSGSITLFKLPVYGAVTMSSDTLIRGVLLIMGLFIMYAGIKGTFSEGNSIELTQQAAKNVADKGKKAAETGTEVAAS